MNDKISFYLRNMQHSEDSVKGTAKGINAYSQHTKEISTIIMNEFQRAQKDSTILYFYLFHEIICGNKDNIENIVKAFGANIMQMTKTICQDQESIENLQNLIKIIDYYEEQKIYVPSFCEKLRNQIRNRVIELNGQQIIEQKKEFIQQNQPRYSKAFVRDYILVQDNPLTKQNYDLSYQEQQYQKKIQEMNKFVLNKEDQDYKLKILEQKQIAFECREMLLQIIKGYGDNYKAFCIKVQQDRQAWTEFNLNNYELLKQRGDDENQSN